PLPDRRPAQGRPRDGRDSAPPADGARGTLTDPVPARRPRPVRRAVVAILSFYLLGFLLSALLLLPLAGPLTRGVSAAELAAHPTPLFALGQGVVLLLAFGAATWVVGIRALKLTR